MKPIKDRMTTSAFLGPAVVTVGAVLLIPFGYTIVRSFFSSGSGEFAGLANYGTIFTDPTLQRSLFNTVFWAVGALVLPVTAGLLIAVMTNSMKLGALARAVVIIPYAFAGTVVAIIGTTLFSTVGAINQALELVGLEENSWLLVWPSNVISSIVISSWQMTGVNVVLFMVGLQTIPKETLEAAAIDGAGGIIRFRNIVLPQIRAITAVVIGLTITNALRAFDVIWVLTRGGPNRSSETLALSMYRQSFLLLDPGVGSALAVVLAIVVVAASWLYLRRQIKTVS